MDSLKNVWLCEQHLSQTQSGMSEHSPQCPQQALTTSNNLHLPPSGTQCRLFISPQPPLETSSFCFPQQQQQWESSTIRNHQTQNEQNKAQAQFTEPQSPQPTGALSHQDRKQGNTTKGDNATGSCCVDTALVSQTRASPSPDDKAPSSVHHCQVSRSLEATRRADAWTVPNNSVVDSNTATPSKAFTYSDPEQDTKDWPPNDYTSQSSISGMSDMSSKFQSFFLTGQFHGFQPGECLTSGLRPVQSCLDYPEDTSSSDDEGKLIIEL